VLGGAKRLIGSRNKALDAPVLPPHRPLDQFRDFAVEFVAEVMDAPLDGRIEKRPLGRAQLRNPAILQIGQRENR
jgi:hypothetical protein